MSRITSPSSLSRRVVRPLPAPRGWPRVRTGDAVLIAALLLVGLVAHGLNMFNYPSFTFTEDEGVLASQTWAVVREGRLSPYTYIYEHAPAAQLLAALWTFITGGPRTFGGVIDGGRVLMLVLHLAMLPLLFRLARRLGCGSAGAAIATVALAISPLAVFYNRLFLPDTIMLFWALASLDLLLDGWGRLSRMLLSGACFGLAVLTRESALVLLPAIIFLAVQQRWQHQGRFAVSGWITATLVVLSWYPLFALLKGELWPTGQASFPGSAYAGSGVSLLDALISGLTRGGGGPFNLHNQFWNLLRHDWLRRDAVLLLGGVLAVGINLVRGVRVRRVADRRALAAGLLGLMPLLYLARGGLVLNYEILLALPFLALNLGVLAQPVLARTPSRLAAPAVLAVAVLIAGGAAFSGAGRPLFAARPGEVPHEAAGWIRENIPSESRIIVRDDLWADLRASGGGGPAFPNVYSHWKVAGDPAVRKDIFRDDWRNVDYLILQPGMEEDFAASNNVVARDALAHASLVRRWQADGPVDALHPTTVIELWKVNKAGALEVALLNESNSYMTSHFERDGAFAGPDGVVTSEAQSYAMLRAVWSDDRSGFNRAWGWTSRNLMPGGGLPAWQWKSGAILDANSAADADTDIALALLMAGRRWNDPALRDAGTRMVQLVWERDVVTLGGTPYMTAGPWAVAGPVVALNPSYFAPYAYHIFAEVDPRHNWLGVVDSSYRVLFDSSSAALGSSGSAGLPPDWVGIDRSTGTLQPLTFNQGDPARYTRYGYDAPRTYWRIALDQRWTGDGRAEAFLGLAGFLRNEIVHQLPDGTRKGRTSAIYAHNGDVIEGQLSLVSTTGALAALLTLDPPTAEALYTTVLVGGAQRGKDGVYWGEADDIYGHEWAWFGVALYADALPDLWHTP